MLIALFIIFITTTMSWSQSWSSSKINEKDQCKIIAPKIAYNGAIVPVTADFDSSSLSKNDYYTSLEIFIEKNTKPLVARLQYLQVTKNAYFAARIRFRQSSQVVAIASTRKGKRVISKSFVKVNKGGCSKNPCAKIGTVILKPGTPQKGQPLKIQAVIIHPQIIGSFGRKRPHFVTNIFLYYRNRSVIRIQTNENLSENPYIALKIPYPKKGAIKILFRDSQGKYYSKTAMPPDYEKNEY